MKHSFAFFTTSSLNALALAVALAAVSNHFMGLIEVGVVLFGLLLQFLLAAYRLAIADWLVLHSIIGRLVVLGSVTLLVFATSPQRSVQNLGFLIGVYTLVSTLLSLSPRLIFWKRKRGFE